MRRIKENIANNVSLRSKRKGACGRKKIISPRTERKLIKIIKGSRAATNATITQEVQDSGVAVSERTVRRSLYALGFKSRRPVKKPKLTTAMKRKRLLWARKYRTFTSEDWDKVSCCTVFLKGWVCFKFWFNSTVTLCPFLTGVLQ